MVELTHQRSMIATVVSAVTMITAFTLFGFGVTSFWIAFVIGFGAVLPASIAVADHYQKQIAYQNEIQERSQPEDSLEELKRKFVDGEISEAQFERQVQKLVETEDIEKAKEYVDRDEKNLEFETN